MENKKLYLYSGLAIATALAIYYLVAKKSNPDFLDNNAPEGDAQPDVTTGTGDTITAQQAQMDKELSETLKKSSSEVTKLLLNKSVYTKLDNVKTRSQNFVNNGWINNLFITIPDKGTFLGNIIQVIDDKGGAKNAEGRVFKWFKIFPSQPAKDVWKSYTSSNTNMPAYYVREDVITLKKP